MKNVTVRIGLDIARKNFVAYGVDQHGKGSLKKKLQRKEVLSFFTQLTITSTATVPVSLLATARLHVTLQITLRLEWWGSMCLYQCLSRITVLVDGNVRYLGICTHMALMEFAFILGEKLLPSVGHPASCGRS